MSSLYNARILTAAVALCAATLSGCSSSSDALPNANLSSAYSGPQVTVLVTNVTCAGGHCDSLDVRLFPEAHLNSPGGLWNVSLGTVTGAQMCLSLPMSQVQRAIGPVTEVHNNPDGTTYYGPNDHPDTTMVTWTPRLAAALGTLRSGDNAFAGSPSTNPFVAGASTGWSVTLPGGEPVAAPACH